MISPSSSPVTGADQSPSYEESMAQNAVLGNHDVQSASADATVSLRYQATVPVLPDTSQKANVDTHKVSAVSVCSGSTHKSPEKPDNSAPELPSRELADTLVSTFVANNPKIAYCLRNPEFHKAAVTMLALYSLHSKPQSDDDSQEPKSKSKKALCELVMNNIECYDIIFPYIAVPGCGRFDPVRFLGLMLSLCESAYQDAFPKTVISIGSGQAFLEKCFDSMGGVSVKCYDRKPLTRFLPVEQAEFPKDINKCLPDDCSSCLLVSGYPQGYLGPVLTEFIRRGGEMLCTTVEGGLFSDVHEGYEDNPKVLRDGIKKLRKKNGAFFEVQLTDYTLMGPASFIQFYNWPSSVKQLMFDSRILNGLCSDIEFPRFLTSRSR